MHAWLPKVSSSNLNTHILVYQISKFYMQIFTQTVHKYYTQTTCILHACRRCNHFDRYCKPHLFAQHFCIKSGMWLIYNNTRMYQAVNLHKPTLLSKNFAVCIDLCSKMIRTSQNLLLISGFEIRRSQVQILCPAPGWICLWWPRITHTQLFYRFLSNFEKN